MPLTFQERVASPKQKLIILLFAAAGPLFLVGSGNEFVKHQDLLRNGVPTTAQVLSAQLENGTRGASRYRLNVRYKAQNVPQTSVLYLYKDAYEALENAKTIPILVAKENPKSVELQGSNSDILLGILTGLFMTLFGWWGVFPTFVRKPASSNSAL